MSGLAADLVRQYVQRLERLYEERAGILQDIRDVFAEAKAVGLDATTLRAAMKRREVSPDERAERDFLLQAYEAALGGDEETVPDARPDLAALAVSMLAEQIEGIEDPAQAQALIGHVVFLLDLRAEIALLRGQESDRKKLAKAEGFEPKQVHATVRWFERVAKHGEEAMRAGEAVFRLYRSTVETGRAESAGVTGDPMLARMFAPAAPAKPTNKSKTLERLRAEAAAARRAREA